MIRCVHRLNYYSEFRGSKEIIVTFTLCFAGTTAVTKSQATRTLHSRCSRFIELSHLTNRKRCSDILNESKFLEFIIWAGHYGKIKQTTKPISSNHERRALMIQPTNNYRRNLTTTSNQRTRHPKSPRSMKRRMKQKWTWKTVDQYRTQWIQADLRSGGEEAISREIFESAAWSRRSKPPGRRLATPP